MGQRSSAPHHEHAVHPHRGQHVGDKGADNRKNVGDAGMANQIKQREGSAMWQMALGGLSTVKYQNGRLVSVLHI